MTYDDFVAAAGVMLASLVDEVRHRVPSSRGGVCPDLVGSDGMAQPYASFVAADDGDAVALCVQLRRSGAGIVCIADVVRESGEIISEVTSIKVPDLRDARRADAALEDLRTYVESQAAVVSAALRRGD